MTTRYLAEQAYPAWNTMVSASAEGSIYSTPEYLEILCRAAGGRFTILGVFRAEQLVGGVALYFTRTPFGESISNRLLLYYNSIVLAKHDTRYPGQRTARELEILAGLERELSSLKCVRLRLHNRCPLTDVRPFLERGWSARPQYSYVVPLADLEILQQRVDKNFKRLIRRCEQKGVVLTEDDDFDSFFALHEQTHQRKGSPLYLPRESFKRYVDDLRSAGLGCLYHARLPDGRSVAAQLVLLGEHPVTHTVCAGAEPEFMKIGTTPFLRWRAFEELAKRGYQANDLTDAALNPVTRFKSQLGGDLRMHLVVSKPDRRLFAASQKMSRLFARGKSFLKRRLQSSS